MYVHQLLCVKATGKIYHVYWRIIYIINWIYCWVFSPPLNSVQFLLTPSYGVLSGLMSTNGLQGIQWGLALGFPFVSEDNFILVNSQRLSWVPSSQYPRKCRISDLTTFGAITAKTIWFPFLSSKDRNNWKKVSFPAPLALWCGGCSITQRCELLLALPVTG